MRMRHIVICGLTELYSTYRHYPIIGTIFGGKKNYWHEMCLLIFSIVRNISLPKIIWARYDQKFIYVCLWSTRYSCQVLMKRVFLADFRKIFKCEILRKPFQWEPNCSMRTDKTKIIVVFRNFAKAPKKTDTWHIPDLHTFIPKVTSCYIFALYSNYCGKKNKIHKYSLLAICQASRWYMPYTFVRVFNNGTAEYKVIHKSLREFRTRLGNNQDKHGRKEHINR